MEPNQVEKGQVEQTVNDQTTPKRSKKWWVISIIALIIIALGTGYYWNNQDTRNPSTKLGTGKSQTNSNDQDTNNETDVPTADSGQTTTPDTPSTTPKATTDETADWKTYTSSKYAYSFKYPTDWVVKDITANNSHTKSLIGLIVATTGEEVGDSWYQVQITSNSLASEVDKVISSVNTNQELLSNTEIQKYGKTITSVALKNKTTQKTSTQYFVSNNNQTYMLTGPSSDSTANTVIGNKILETFQFTSK